MSDERRLLQSLLADAFGAAAAGSPEAAAAAFDPAAVVDVSAPVERLAGAAAIRDGFLAPLARALSGLHRRDEIVIGGENRRAEGGRWVAVVTHYVGTFTAPLFGIAPSQRLVFLRAGEFHRIENGRIKASRIIIDLPDLIRQAGGRPFAAELGTEMLFPGPATHDGVCPPDRARGGASLDLAEAMLGDLHVFDPATFASAGQTGYWAEDMFWYGPGGIGSNFRWQGFVKDHREPFLLAFPDRKGGNHYCRIGDGDYAAVSGWPSMTMTHSAPYLGVPATGRKLTLRVMDFYRCAGGRIAENWVFLDLVDLFAQMGVDVIRSTGPA